MRDKNTSHPASALALLAHTNGRFGSSLSRAAVPLLHPFAPNYPLGQSLISVAGTYGKPQLPFRSAVILVLGEVLPLSFLGHLVFIADSKVPAMLMVHACARRS
jgi:hypothetical protein